MAFNVTDEMQREILDLMEKGKVHVDSGWAHVDGPTGMVILVNEGPGSKETVGFTEEEFKKIISWYMVFYSWRGDK